MVGKAEQAFSKDFQVFNSSLGARFPNPKIESVYGADTMPQTSDNLARDYQISREECDVFALGSQQKYAKAAKDGFFQSEIRPVTIPQGRGKPDLMVSEDEHPRPETTMDALMRLKPLYAEGVTTAGNSSGINDGAVAMVIASREPARRRACSRWRASSPRASPAWPPRIMGFGPVPAAKRRWSAPGSRSRTWT